MKYRDGEAIRLDDQNHYAPYIGVTISEGDRQTILMALAMLAIDRPGWDSTLTRLAGIFKGKDIFERLKDIHWKPPEDFIGELEKL